MKENIVEINMMLGGEKPSELPSGKLWCGVDRGAIYLLNKNEKVVVACGDFDSISSEEKENLRENCSYFLEKESQYETDTDFALNNLIALFPNLKTINIYGATGRRLDHFYGNMLLLNNAKYEKLALSVIDNNNIIMVAKKGENIFTAKAGYKYFSVVPIYENTVMTILGAKYEAENLVLSLDRPNATSNEFNLDNNITLTLSKNSLVIYSKD